MADNNNNNNGHPDDIDKPLLDLRKQDFEVHSPVPLNPIDDFRNFGLRPEFLLALDANHFKKPAKIQQYAIPAIMQHRDKSFIGQAQSGSGKTLAFVISMLSAVDERLERAQILCIGPTREIVMQNYEVACKIAANSKIDIFLDVPETKWPKVIKQQVIIGTPGRISSSLDKDKFDGHGIKIFVVDEADEMLDLQGQREQVLKIFSFLSPNCQFCLFSATFNPAVKEFCKEIIKEPCIKLFLKTEELKVEKLIHTRLVCREDSEKFGLLNEIFSYVNIGQCIIFAHTRKRVREIYQFLKEKGHEVSRIYGHDMSAADRDKTIKDFREGKNRILVSTNVLARGIDVLQVSLVINFDIPLTRDSRPDAETYLHRVGRTARYDKPGLAINFVHDDFSAQGLRFIANTFTLTVRDIGTQQLSQIAEELKKMENMYKKHEKKKN